MVIYMLRGDNREEGCCPHRCRLNTQEILFMFLDIIGGGNEGGVGIYRRLAIDIESPLERCPSTLGTFSSRFLRVAILLSVVQCACQAETEV